MGLAIPVGSVTLSGDLAIPAEVRGVVLFAHGTGSSRHSPRNKYVARVLGDAGFATVLMDLLTEAEESEDQVTGRLRFDIDLLAERLLAATSWLSEQPSVHGLSVGYFGASTGAGAALVAAAERPESVGAVVSRGGRPDMAAKSLPLVRAPTLLIVGGYDHLVLDLNRGALDELTCEKRLAIVAGASHLFEERGTLQEAAELARDWFEDHMGFTAPRPGAKRRERAPRGLH